MKTLLTSLMLLALGAGPALAQLSEATPDFQSVKILQTSTPVFPEALIAVYRNGGHARVEISVGEDGKLGELLVTGYTHPKFAKAAVEAIKEWEFEPARWKGEAVSVSITLNFDFEVKGVVVSTTASELIEAQFNSILGSHDVYGPCTLRELDRIPIPVKSVSPAYSKDLANRGVAGEVTVEFYIDEQGAVRMPFVLGRPSVALANLAVSAVRQWAFEPPTRHGQPVLVHVRQLFRFKPTAMAIVKP